ncbi:MAG: MFS transporter [Dehalococcoidia bacterium]
MSGNGASRPGAPYTETPPSGRIGTFASLAIPNFRYLWLGQLSHAGALWMEQIARPFLILELTDGSATHIGGVIAVRTLPQLLFGVWAGVIADWFDRRMVLLIDKTAVLVLNILFAALIVSGALELWHIYAYAFLRGTMMAFDQPARSALIPSIVPAERVTNAIALMSATQNTMRIVGAALGGFAYAAFGAEGAFVMIAVIYVGAVVSTYMLDVPTHERPESTGPRAMARGLLDGARYAASHTAIRGVLILSLVYFTFGMSYMQVFAPLFAEKVLDIGSFGFGFMTSLTGVGALMAALVIANRQPSRLGLILPLLAGVFGVVLVAFSVSTYLPRPAGLIVPLLLLAVIGSVQTSYFSLARAMMLHAAPEAMRGRVISLLSLDRAVMTAGAAVAGLLSDTMGVQPAQIIYGVICAAGGFAVLMLARGFRATRTVYTAAEAAGPNPTDDAERSTSAGQPVDAPLPTAGAR